MIFDRNLLAGVVAWNKVYVQRICDIWFIFVVRRPINLIFRPY